MGGSGKTELMRQFLKICKVENLVDYICVIQYEGGLAKSFVNAFSQIYGTDIKENYQEALARIRRYADKNVLIVIDNVDSEVEDAELEEQSESAGNTSNYDVETEAVTSGGKTVKISYDSNVIASLDAIDGSVLRAYKKCIL